jgi:fatty acid amide hydrolase 2
MMSLHTASATELATLVREGRIRSRQLVDAHIEQVERVNPSLNAMVAERFADAREEADIADEQLASASPDSLPPFHGVPCSIKECFALEGMPNSSGLVSRKHIRASEDAPAVARIRAAGAIPLGVTNTSELCMWMESDNKVYGRTGSAYSPARTCGGSSGGEAAIVGSGAAPFGLGSDIGGSIRMPAFFNGVFGHKGSSGLIPNTGQFPVAVGDALRYLSTGPICRRAEDLWPLVKLLAGPDGQDSACTPMALGDPSEVRIERLRVLDLPHDGSGPVDPGLRRAQERVMDFLASRGARIERVEYPELSQAMDIWSCMLAAAGGPSYAELLGGGREINRFVEIIRYLMGRSPYTLPSLGLALIEKLPGLMPSRVEAAIEAGRALKAKLAKDLRPNTILLYPSHPVPAPVHMKALLPPLNWTYTAILNVMELPVTQVPMGLDGSRRPLGVQVAAAHGADHLTVGVALELERAFGGWIPPWRV